MPSLICSLVINTLGVLPSALPLLLTFLLALLVCSQVPHLSPRYYLTAAAIPYTLIPLRPPLCLSPPPPQAIPLVSSSFPPLRFLLVVAFC